MMIQRPTREQASVVLLAVLLLMAACDVRQEAPVPDEREMLARATKLYDEGSLDKAEELFTDVAPLLKSSSRLRDLATVHSTLSRIAFASGRYRRAISLTDSAIAVSVDARDYRLEAAQWLQKGDMLSDLSEYSLADQGYRKALSLYMAFNDRRSRCRTLLREGRNHLLEGRTQDALDVFAQAMTISTEDGARLETAEALSGIAEAYYIQKAYSQSANTYIQAGESAAGDAHLEGRIQLGLARALRAQGDLPGAASALQQILGTDEALGKPMRTLCLFELGRIQEDQVRAEEAEKSLEAAIALARETGDQIALDYLDLFRIRLAERSISASERNGQLSALVERYRKAAEAFALIDNRTGEAYARICKARLLRRMNHLEDARKEYELALDVEDSRLGEFMDPERHLLFTQELGLGPVREGWYRELATLLVQMNDLRGALNVMERARLRRQFTVLRQDPPNLRIQAVQSELDSLNPMIHLMTSLQREISGMLAVRPLRVLPQHIGGLKKELKELQRQAVALSERIGTRVPNYAPAVYLGEMPNLDLQSSIPSGTVVVQYLPDNEQLIILALTSRKLESRRVPVSRAKLSGLLTEYMTLLQDPNVYAGAGGEASIEPMLRFATISPELYTFLLKPLESLFQNRVIVIPDGMLEGFPLHALEQQGSGGEIRYLMEIVDVEYAPSLTSLIYRTIEPRSIRSITGIGNPTGKDWSIDYELRDLRSFFKDAQIYTGLDATWSRMLNGEADLVMLATDFENPVPELSYGSIGFSDGVTSGELIFEPFEDLIKCRPAPVMILSDHTAGGAGLRPDHANLIRLRGTREVILNAWPADRKAAKFFSEFFVTHIANGLTPAEAFRQALLSMIRIRDVAHPRSWGQFFRFGGL